MPTHDAGWADGFGQPRPLIDELLCLAAVLLHLAALICGGGWTTAPQRQEGRLVNGNELQRVHAADERFRLEAEFLMDSAKPLVSQKDAGSVIALGQTIPPLENALAHHRAHAAIIRVFVPLLLAQPPEIIVVQRYDVSATALAAAGAVPAFDDGQRLDR